MFITRKKFRTIVVLLILAIVFYFVSNETLKRRQRAPATPPTQPHPIETHHGPTIGPLYSDDVINPHLYTEFIVSNSDACGVTASKSHPVFLLLLVKCKLGEFHDRTQVRKTWGSVTSVDGLKTKTMFLVGASINPIINSMIAREDSQYHDIIQGNLIDHYLNSTHKTLLGWKWVSEFCPQTKYVASVDADALVNVANIVRRLATKPRRNYAEGDVQFTAPHFSGEMKWHTKLSMYPDPTYPAYLAGACFVFSADVAANVYKESIHVRYLPWEDVFHGLVLKKLGVTLRGMRGYVQYHKGGKAIGAALARGQAVLVGTKSRQKSGEMKKFGPSARLVKIWQKIAREQNGVEYKNKLRRDF